MIRYTTKGLIRMSCSTTGGSTTWMAGQLTPGSPKSRPTMTCSTSPPATARAAMPIELAADRSVIPLSRPHPYPTRQKTSACSPSR